MNRIRSTCRRERAQRRGDRSRSSLRFVWIMRSAQALIVLGGQHQSRDQDRKSSGVLLPPRSSSVSMFAMLPSPPLASIMTTASSPAEVVTTPPFPALALLIVWAETRPKRTAANSDPTVDTPVAIKTFAVHRRAAPPAIRHNTRIGSALTDTLPQTRMRGIVASFPEAEARTVAVSRERSELKRAQERETVARCPIPDLLTQAEICLSAWSPVNLRITGSRPRCSPYGQPGRGRDALFSAFAPSARSGRS